MRLVGIGLLAFLLAAIAMGASNSNLIQTSLQAFNNLWNGPRMAFETAHAIPSIRSKSHDAIIQRSDFETPIILTGLPAYHSATFHMPVDARPTSGFLHIDATVQASAGINGVLRVSIGSKKRAEVLLYSGRADRSLQIQLTQREIAQDRLVVSFSLRGDGGAQSSCSSGTCFDAIVEIESTSAIFLNLQEPLQSERDKILVAGRSARVPWSQDRQAENLTYASALLKAGVTPIFYHDDNAQAPPNDVLPYFQANMNRAEFAWSSAFYDKSSLFGMRRFNKAYKWQVKYNFMDARDRRTAGKLHLDILLGALAKDGLWQVTATLNGALVGQITHPAGPAKFTIDLENARQMRSNKIEIALRPTYPSSGGRPQSSGVVAEILPSSKISPSTSYYSDSYFELYTKLVNGWGVTKADLSIAQALLAAHLLAALPEQDPTAQFAAKVQAIGRGTDLDLWRADADSFWLVRFDDAGMVRAETVNDYPFQFSKEVMLIFDLSGVAT